MKYLMLVAATILVLAGGALPSEAAAGAAEAIYPASAKSESDESGDDGTEKGKVEIVRVEPIIFQLPGPGRLRRSVSVSLSLALTDTRRRDEVVEKRAKLRARIFEAWAGVPLVSSSDENFDPEEIKRRAQHVSDSLFGAGVVDSVLIEDIREVLIR